MSIDTHVTVRADRIPLVRNVGYNKTKSVWTHPRRCLNFNVFLYIGSGIFQVIEEGREYLLNEGDIFFLKSGLHHWGEPKTIVGTSWYCIHFYESSEPDEEALPELSPALSSKRIFEPIDHRIAMALPKKHRVSDSDLMVKRLKTLFNLYRSSDLLRSVQLGLKTAELFAEVYKDARLIEKPSKTDDTVKMVIDYLRCQSLTSKFDASAVSGHVQMNYNYLSSIFTERMGISISEYYTRLRIEKAMEMMKNPALSISEIGYKLGFSSPFHFSKTFKKTAGISPSAYMSQIYRNSNPDNHM